MLEKFNKRAVLFLSLLALVFGIFALKLFALQVVEGEANLDKATSTTMVTLPLTAARGEIVDRYGRPIATSRQAYSVRLIGAILPKESLNDTLLALVQILEANGESWNDDTPLTNSAPYAFVQDKDAAVAKMRSILKLADYATAQNVYDKMVERYELSDYPAEYRRKLAGLRYQMEYEEYGIVNPFIIASDVSITTVSQVKEHNLDLPGVDIVETAVRSYADSTLMPHLLGTLGKIDAETWPGYKQQGYKMNALVGKSGIELAFEQELKGTDGRITLERTKSGQILSTTTVTEAQPGNTVVLTIDRDLQAATQKILENQIAVIAAKNASRRPAEPVPTGGAIVVIDVKTGGVLASATWPTYDILNYKTGAGYAELAANENLPLFNRATSGLYRPGSTFKCAVAVDGLLTGEIDRSSSLYCSGVYTFWPDYPAKCTHSHGTVTVTTALRDSCNSFFYDVGRRLGLESFNAVASTLGLGQKTGLEISEASGNLSTPEYHESMTDNQWQKGNVIQAAIGQMDTQVTPMQLATYATSLANEGRRLKTHLVAGVQDYNGTQMLKTTDVTEQASLDATADALDSAFSIVEEGMLMASRTGTATQFLGTYVYNVASKTGTSQNNHNYYDATIIAYGPTEDPEIAIGAVVENCGNGYELARSVRDIFDEYYALKNANTTVVPAGVLLE